MALNPPSRLRTQLFAYWLVAKNRAASAISEACPNLLRGMELRASERASGVIATPCTLEYIGISRRRYAGMELVQRQDEGM